MLRWKLGDSTFFRGLRQYLADPLLQYKNARTGDLQRNLESVSGQNLTEFFKDWIYGEGYPDYEGEWSVNSRGRVNIKLLQTTSHSSVSFFEMPVPLQFKNSTRDTIITVTHSSNGETFNLNPGFVPDTMIIDPKLWILAKNKQTKKLSQLIAPSELTVYPNPVVNDLSIYLPLLASQKINVRLFNTSGQMVFAKQYATAGNEEILISTHNLASGIYWLQVITGSETVVKKLVILNK
jgi:hypothetical protein